MVYLITGATGNVGSLVVERLIARGDRPRIFVRDADNARARFGDRVDIFAGDLAVAKTLTPALAGTDAVLLVNSGPELAALDDLAAKTAKAAGTKRLVKLSSYDTRENVGTGVWHAAGEAAIRATGIPFVFVQPSGFMVNALWWADSIKSEGIVRSATGDGKIPFIHSDDMADVVVQALTAPQHLGQSLAITGPEPLSYASMTAKIGIAIGRTLRFEPVSEDEERRKMVSHGDSAEIVAAHLSIYRAIREGRLAAATDSVERVLGRKPITFDQWVQQNVPRSSGLDLRKLRATATTQHLLNH
jgi:uncharacterized protein YbjT (DUF2867 family)